MAIDTVPSWDDNFPAKQQAQELDAVNHVVPDETLPKSDKKISAPMPSVQAQPAPANQTNRIPASETQSSSPQEPPPRYEDTSPVPPKYEDSTPLPEQASNEQGINLQIPDNSAMRKYVEGNLQVYNAANADKQPQPEQHPANSMIEALEAGLQISTAGLAIRGKMPDIVTDENSSRAYRIASQIGSLAGDMPAMMAGGVLGGLAGSEVPVVGNAAGAMAGSFALPAALRKIMIDHYQKGDIQTAGEFVDRLMATTWEAAKGGAVGLATAGVGRAAGLAAPMVLPVSGSMAKIGAELATMTTVGAAMEGHLPHAQDFLDGALLLGGFHGLGMVSEKLRNIYAATGERPETVIQATATNPQLKQDLLSQDKEAPAQAAPTKLADIPAKEEGEEPARNQLVPQDLSVSEKPEPMDESNLTDAEKSIKSMIGEEPDEKSKTFSEHFNDFYAKNVDGLDPLKVAYETIKSLGGEDLEAKQQPYVLGRVLAGHEEFFRRVLEEGVPDRDGNFDPENTDSLNKIYRDVPNDEQGKFDLYSIAKRAIELQDQGKNPGANFDRAAAEQVVKDGEAKFQELHERRVQVMNDALQYGVDKGVIDKNIARKSMEQNQDYVPMNRILTPDELTGEIDGKQEGALVKKIEGSDLDIKNPRMGFYNNIRAILKRAAINDVRLAAIDNLTIENEDGTTENPFLQEVKFTGKANQVPLYRDGKLSALEGTPGTIEALQKLEGDPASAGVAMTVAKAMAKAVRVGTVADPGFGIRHGIRAAVSTFFYTKTGQIPFIHPLMALSEFMKGESDTYKNWLSDGGATKGIEDMTKSYIENDLQEADTKYPFLNQAWNVIKKPFQAAEVFIKMTDNLSRFVEYKRTLEQGGDRTQAAFNAREVTPDFAKQGAERSAFRTAVAFQGAHINSLDRMRQAFAEDWQGTTLKMSALTAISALLWYANKDDKDIADLPNYKKDLYWNFNVHGMFNKTTDSDQTGTIFSIPKPWAPGILFGSGIERTLDSFFKDKPDAFKGFGHSIWESVVPNFIPTAVQPVLDQYANKNAFTGRALVTTEQQKELPEMQYQPYTSETAKQLGKLISYVPLVKDIGPSSDPLASPAVVENYIQGWTGVAGSWALKISDAGLKMAGIGQGAQNKGPSSVDTPIAEEPILKEFMTRFPSMKEQPIQDFYDNLDQTQKVMNSIRDAQKKGDFDTAASLQVANQGMQVRLTGISSAIATGRKTIKNIQDNPDIAPVEKRQLIDGIVFQIGSAAKMGNKMMSDFQKQIDKNPH